MELERLHAECADRVQAGAHVLLALARNAEDEVRAHLQAGRAQPRHGVDTIPVPVVAVEQAQAPRVDGLDPQFDQAVLAALAAEISQGWGQVGGNGVRPGGEDQADAVRLGQDPGTALQQQAGGQGGGGFLLKIAEKKAEPVAEEQLSAAAELLVEGVGGPQGAGGEARRTAEHTAAAGAVGAGNARVERDLAHRAAVTLAAVDAEGAQAGRGSLRAGRGQGGQGRGDQ